MATPKVKEKDFVKGYLSKIPEKDSQKYGIFQNLKKSGMDLSIKNTPLFKGMDSRGVFQTLERPNRTTSEHIFDLHKLATQDRASIKKAQARKTQELFQQGDTYFKVTPEMAKSFCTFTAWRLVREYCRIFGILKSDECLTESMDSRGYYDSAWYMPRLINPRDLAQKKFYSHVEEVIDLAMTVKYLPDELQESRPDPISNKKVIYPGLAVMPPRKPSAFEDSENSPYKYTVDNDPRIHLYCKIMELIATGLGVYKGSAMFKDLGTVSMSYFDDPETIRENFPTPQEIINVEEQLIDEVTAQIRTSNINRTRESLIKRYGLNRQEVSSLIRLTKNQIQSEMGSVAEERAFMLLHMDDIAERAQLQGDIRAEIAIAKEKGRLLGLDKASAEDEENEDFVDIISELANDRKEIRQKEEEED